MGTEQIPTATPVWSAISMPSGEDSSASVSWRKPTEWRTGKLRYRLWYTSDVGDTDDFGPVVKIYAIRKTEVLPGTSLYSATLALAGPAVANTLLLTDYVYTTTSLGGDDEVFTFHIDRPAADVTNVNKFQLVYVEIEHIPAVGESE